MKTTTVWINGKEKQVPLPLKTAYYCIMCGNQNCWFEDLGDDYYVGKTIKCLTCNHEQNGIYDLNMLPTEDR